MAAKDPVSCGIDERRRTLHTKLQSITGWNFHNEIDRIYIIYIFSLHFAVEKLKIHKPLWSNISIPLTSPSPYFLLDLICANKLDSPFRMNCNY